MTLPASQYSVLDAKRVERLDEDTFRCYVGAIKLFSLEVEPVITVSVTVQERGPTVRLLSTKVCSKQRTAHSRQQTVDSPTHGWRIVGLTVRQRPRSRYISTSLPEQSASAWPSAVWPAHTCRGCLPPCCLLLPASLQLKGSKAVEAVNERFDATMTNVVRWQEAADGSGLQLVSDTFIQVQVAVPGWFVLPVSSLERTGASEDAACVRRGQLVQGRAMLGVQGMQCMAPVHRPSMCSLMV